MATPTKNGNGAKEVTPATDNKTTNKPAVNGKTTPTPKAEETPAASEQKPPVAPPAVEAAATAEPAKPKTIEQQLEYYDGLEKLVKRRRILDTHLKHINTLNIDDTDLDHFENVNREWVKITLTDRDGDDYTIEQPVLVRELHTDLIKRVEAKVALYDERILTYGAGA